MARREHGGEFLLKGRYIRPKNELLGGKDSRDGGEYLISQRIVDRVQIEQRNAPGSE